MFSKKPFSKFVLAFFATTFSFLLFSPVPASSQELIGRCKSQITTGGNGEVFVVPDTVSMSFGISERSANLRSASSSMGKSLNDALRVLKQHGVPDRDIQTSHVRIRPEYERPVSPSDRRSADQAVVYFLSQSFVVTLKDPAKYEEIFRALLDVGINEVQNVSFVVSNPKPHNEKALAAAVRDARSKATVIANAASLRLGDRIAINEADTSRPSPRMDGFALRSAVSMDEAGGGLSVGQVSIQANVIATFAAECR